MLRSTRNKQYLHAGDDVFLSFKNPGDGKVGDRYTIYEIGDEIFHPKNKQPLGFMTEEVGHLVLTKDVGDDVWEARIEVAWIEIVAGTRLKPYEKPPSEIKIKATTSKIDGGYIVTSLYNLNSISEDDIIFIDQGEKEGLKAGNLLHIYRERKRTPDPMEANKILTLPIEDLGIILVTRVEEKGSLAIVLKAKKEMQLGDRVRTMGPLK